MNGQVVGPGGAASNTQRRDAGTRQRVFLAAPMSGFDSDHEYRRHRDVMDTVSRRLESNPRVESVYFAGRNILSVNDFSDAGDAFVRDLQALVDCDLFIFYYPTAVRSSVLVEVGIAIGRGKPILLACRRKDDLVFLLRSASDHSGQYGIPPIEIWEWGSDVVDVNALTARISSKLGPDLPT
jgi:hypothetical protein